MDKQASPGIVLEDNPAGEGRRVAALTPQERAADVAAANEILADELQAAMDQEDEQIQA